MRAGFCKVDITPRVGVELCGFGAYLNRHSREVRDQLWARAAAFEHGNTCVVIVSCDLVGVNRSLTHRVRDMVCEVTQLKAEQIMVHCTHTHSGPATVPLVGWGDMDLPYMELLPGRIARACIAAVRNMSEARVLHAEVPCEGVGLNREYDKDAPPLADVLDKNWRPARPELTDTTVHVIKVESDGKVIGFLSYFGCHPVVCCSETRSIHGDYAGVAANLLESDHPGSVGLFLQGAQGDVNSCVVHKPEKESLEALDVVAARYANAVRRGLDEGSPVQIDEIAAILKEVVFSRKKLTREDLHEMLKQHEAALTADDATDADPKVRMATVYAWTLRSLIARLDSGEDLEPATELQGIRIGPFGFLGAPFEIFQAIKNDVKSAAHASVPLVMGLTNDLLGYAPDHQKAKEGGYAADQVPIMLGQIPFAAIHDELAKSLLELDTALFSR